VLTVLLALLTSNAEGPVPAGLPRGKSGILLEARACFELSLHTRIQSVRQRCNLALTKHVLAARHISRTGIELAHNRMVGSVSGRRMLRF
jgi:hypothetical protein